MADRKTNDINFLWHAMPVLKSVAAVPEATGLAERRCMAYPGTHVTAGRTRLRTLAAHHVRPQRSPR
ncbi:MAG: hypothetical protein ACRC2B_12750 [Rubrivivax sp.]